MQILSYHIYIKPILILIIKGIHAGIGSCCKQTKKWRRKRCTAQCKQAQRRGCGLQCKIIDKDKESANRNRGSMWRHKGMNHKGGTKCVYVGEEGGEEGGQTYTVCASIWV